MRAAAAIWSLLWVAGGGSPTGPLLPVPREQLCITNGVITTNGDGSLLIDSPGMRAVVASGAARTVEARLRYLGPTKESKRLASGELRRQFGFKLRAANTCNVVYVMWHIEPDTRVAASVKNNPGMTTHAQCDAHGYRNLKPSHQSPVPVLRPREWHRLRASLAGETLMVSLDGTAVWQGTIGADGMSFDGPVGMRSDNGRFEVELFQSAPEGGAFHPANPCQTDPGDAG
jgi:hypothetical protein